MVVIRNCKDGTIFYQSSFIGYNYIYLLGFFKFGDSGCFAGSGRGEGLID